jgi:hypothetical protein
MGWSRSQDRLVDDRHDVGGLRVLTPPPAVHGVGGTATSKEEEEERV